MENDNYKKSEWTPEELEYRYKLDVKRNPLEHLHELYKEANNSEQPVDNRMAKTIMKFSALFVRLSDDQARATKRLECLTVWLVILTAILSAFTAYLCIKTYQSH